MDTMLIVFLSLSLTNLFITVSTDDSYNISNKVIKLVEEKAYEAATWIDLNTFIWKGGQKPLLIKKLEPKLPKYEKMKKEPCRHFEKDPEFMDISKVKNFDENGDDNDNYLEEISEVKNSDEKDDNNRTDREKISEVKKYTEQDDDNNNNLKEISEVKNNDEQDEHNNNILEEVTYLHIKENSSIRFILPAVGRYITVIVSNCSEAEMKIVIAFPGHSMAYDMRCRKSVNWKKKLPFNSGGPIFLTIEVILGDIEIEKISINKWQAEKEVFELTDDGRKRLSRLTRYQTKPVLVSVMGLRGAGKSTIASLISGDDLMFKQGTTSTNTTTLGIDMSPIISMNAYITKMSKTLGYEAEKMTEDTPLLITDSEGICHTNTSCLAIPPLLLADVLIWVTEGADYAENVLKDIFYYMGSVPRVFCEKYKAGNLIIVVNKMKGKGSDLHLTGALFPNATMKLKQNGDILKILFTSVSVIGFPFLNIPEGTSGLTYDVINKADTSARFFSSLSKIAKIVSNSKSPRHLNGKVIFSYMYSGIIDQMLEKVNYFDKDPYSAFNNIVFQVEVRNALKKTTLKWENALAELNSSQNLTEAAAIIEMLYNTTKNEFIALKKQHETSQNEESETEVNEYLEFLSSNGSHFFQNLERGFISSQIRNVFRETTLKWENTLRDLKYSQNMTEAATNIDKFYEATKNEFSKLKKQYETSKTREFEIEITDYIESLYSNGSHFFEKLTRDFIGSQITKIT